MPSQSLHVNSEASRALKQELAMTPSVLSLLAMPRGHLELTLRLWAWQWCWGAFPFLDWAEAIHSSFLRSASVCPPLPRGIIQPALLICKAGNAHPQFSMHTSQGIQRSRKQSPEQNLHLEQCSATKRFYAKGHFAHKSGAAFSFLINLKIHDASIDFQFLIIFPGKTGK